MTRKQSPSSVFFNASVLLAGLNSPSGGSAKLLKWIKQKKITGIISEIVLDEALQHAEKIKHQKKEMQKKILETFDQVAPPPKLSSVEKFKEVIIDYGDAHILASCQEEKADFLVTLDKKHLLSLSKKIKPFKIVSPKQLIEKLS